MAAGQGISALTSLTALARADVLEVTDVSDTTDSDDGSTRKVTAETLPGVRLQGNISGRWYAADPRWYSAEGGFGGWSMDTLGHTWWGLLDPGEVVTIDGLGCEVSTAGASGSTIRFGLWVYPSSTSDLVRIVDGGTVATATGGAKELTLGSDVTLRRALISVTAQGGSVPSLYGINPIGNQDPVGGMSSVSTGHAGLMANTSTTSGALPSTLSWALSAGQTRWPILFYRVA